ncbi:hypothetical protein [Streptomyces lavendulae]|uniref:hypothetical protein n=1 Tax=Streptomyces lavendulae TaxID=1914 RepID=UPI0024A15339|nr:hypothetical protein [Streptomyces lavendulae]GLW04185.1 hypothetical protein Slala05_78150 [Streptomyces lavendulae subsp. lavendulae]
MTETTDHTHAYREALKLFPPPLLTPSPACACCQAYARHRDRATGPLSGAVVTDMQVLMKRCARNGHR